MLFKFVFGQFIDTLYLEVGEHLFNFEFQTQLELPSSFYSEYGYIKYSASVVLIIPWGFDIKFEQPITINRTVDLNRLYPAYDVLHFTPYLCGCLGCFRSDPLHIVASIPVGGYVPGQTIDLSLEVDNKSNQRVPYFQMQLVKVGDFDFEFKFIFNADFILARYILCWERFEDTKVPSNFHNIVTWR